MIIDIDSSLKLKQHFLLIEKQEDLLLSWRLQYQIRYNETIKTKKNEVNEICNDLHQVYSSLLKVILQDL